MGHEGQDILITDALVFLFAAGVLVPLFRMARLPIVVGFILAGILLGPNGLGHFDERWPALEFITISDPHAAEPFAELGILFLLFLLGLELSFGKLWALRRVVFGAGGLQAALSALAIGGVAYMLGLDAPAAAVIGLALALSSTAIVMQLVIESRRAAMPVGRAALGVLLLQDLLVAPILIFVGFAANDGGDVSLLARILEALVQGTLAVVIIVLIGRYALRRVFRLAAHAGGRDFLMALTLLAVVGSAAMTASAGLSLALGAFLAGLLLGETEFKHQTEVDLEPFKGLLLGLFFMTVGMGLDLAAITSLWPQVLGGLAALLVAKAVIAFVAVRLFAGGNSLATETSFLLAPAGEFAFVVVSAALAAGVVTSATATLVAAIAGLSMLLIPVMDLAGRLLARRLVLSGPEVPEMGDYSALEGHVIIAGFGRVGQAIGHILKTEDTDIVGLERDAVRVSRAHEAGWRVYLGDAARDDILLRAGARGAALFVVTVDDPEAAESMVRAFRTLRGDALILARARDEQHALQLGKAGADYVIPDAIEAGLQMAARALESFGYEGETVRDLLAAHREGEYRRASADN
ncbi:MAG: portal protein [Alphaproteobacteria bacterium]|jgi:CPA2 family monovalent cation:H+ antiporter-2|nr:portal protein [Alphaproteobacteria bacterium]